MCLSQKYDHALTKCRHNFVKSLNLNDGLLSFLRSEYVLTEEMENKVRVNRLPFSLASSKNVQLKLTGNSAIAKGPHNALCQLYKTSSSAVVDKPMRCIASHQTAKFLNSHVTVTTPLLLVICRPVSRIDIAYLCTKFDDYRFCRSSDMIEAPKVFNGSHDLTTPQSR